MMQNFGKNPNIIGVIGAALFFYLMIEEFVFFLFRILQDLLLFTDFSSVVIFGMARGFSVTLLIVSFFLLIQKFKNLDITDSKNVKRVLIYSFLGYGLSWLLTGSLPFISEIWQSEGFFEMYTEYLSEFNESGVIFDIGIRSIMLFLEPLDFWNSFLQKYILKNG